MKLMRALQLALLVVATLVGAPLAAQPRDHKQLAADTFRQAQEAFARSEYTAAATAFEQAYSYQPHPSTLLNAAEAWMLASEPVRAAENCERVLNMDDVAASFRKEAQGRLDELAPQLARLELSGPATLTVKIDGGGEIRLPAKRWLRPGARIVTVIDVGASEGRSIKLELRAGEVRPLELKAKPSQPSTPPDATTKHDSESGGVPTASWVAFGVAGAAGIVTAVFGGLTVAAQSDFDDEPTQDHADVFDRNKLVSNIALGVAGAVAATGAVIWIVAESSEDTAALSPALGLTPALGGACLRARMRF